MDPDHFESTVAIFNFPGIYASPTVVTRASLALYINLLSENSIIIE